MSKRGTPNQEFSKVNAISQYSRFTLGNDGNVTNSNLDYQREFSKNNKAFRRPKGMCSEYASATISHQFIAPGFGRR